LLVCCGHFLSCVVDDLESEGSAAYFVGTTAAVGFLIDLWTYLAISDYTSRILLPYPMLFAGLFTCAYGSSLIIMSGIGIRIMDLVALT
jgi:hypothetical protein